MASGKLKAALKNFSYALSSNIISLIISAAAVLIIPRFVGVETYGYYQLYIFYIAYVGVPYLGWCDGIYLRVGGKYYSELDKKLYSTQFILFSIYEVLFYSLFMIVACSFIKDENTEQVFALLSLAAVGVCLRFFLNFILQATGRIQEFAKVTIIERIVFIVLSLTAVFAGLRQFQWLILSDIVGKYVSLGLAVFYCRELIFVKPKFSRYVLSEIKENISVGIQLMFSSLCSMLIIGIVRFGIQNHWDIETFGKVSLTLSISNMIMQAINAIAVVLYPILRRTGEDALFKIYRIMRIALMGLAFGFIAFYYPMQKILGMWLPQYVESLRYAAILLPVCIYESKTSMLIYTYFKTLRMERQLRNCNLTAMIISAVCAFVSITILNSITAAVFSILIALISRSVMGELILSKKMPISVKKDIILEIVMTAAFIICNWFFGFAGMIMYIVCYFVYLLIKKNDIKEIFDFIKNMGNRGEKYAGQQN